MKIILLEKIEKLGEIGKIISVKNGYAKNYLIPKKRALIANKENILKQDSKIKNTKAEKKINSINMLQNTSIIIPVTVKAHNELYVTYNALKITKILKKLNINIKQKNIVKDIFIKKLGSYDLEVKNEKQDIFKMHLIFIKINK
jgi:large subunit ribosomal protein L9